MSPAQSTDTLISPAIFEAFMISFFELIRKNAKITSIPKAFLCIFSPKDALGERTRFSQKRYTSWFLCLHFTSQKSSRGLSAFYRTSTTLAEINGEPLLDTEYKYN